MPPAHYASLAVLLIAAAGAGSTPDVQWILLASVLAATLLLQFRLWDDLADRARDRLEHPHRVLARSSSVTGFWRLAGAAFIANLIGLGILHGPWAALALLALSALFAVWYARPLAQRTGLANAHVMMVKYPAFVVLLAPASHAAAPLACVAVYLTFWAYELLHDRAYRAAPGAPALLALALAGLALVLAAVLWRETSALKFAASGLAAGAMLLGWVYVQWRSDTRLGAWIYAPFGVCVVAVAAIASGAAP